jgi:hypothetical protein
MKKASMRTVQSALKRQWGVDMELWEVIENSAQALKLAGMIALDREVAIWTVDNFTIKLPEHAYQPRWAVYLTNPWPYPRVEVQDIWQPSQVFWRTDEVEETVGSTDETTELNHIPQIKGPYIDYVWECPYMKFNQTDFNVAVMYTSLSLDEDGIPKVPEEAVDLCVQYNNWIYQRPRYIMGKMPKHVMDDIEEWKRRAFAQGKTKRMFNELSQNAMNRMFDVMASADRKKFNIDA